METRITKKELCLQILSDSGKETVSDKDVAYACKKPKSYLVDVYLFYRKTKDYSYCKRLILSI